MLKQYRNQTMAAMLYELHDFLQGDAKSEMTFTKIINYLTTVLCDIKRVLGSTNSYYSETIDIVGSISFLVFNFY
jgi:hypothetical protein